MPAPARPPLLALLAVLVLGAATVAVGGCGGGEDAGRPQLRIYVSAPDTGPGSQHVDDLLDGAELALDDAGGEAAGIEVELASAEAATVPGGGYRQAEVAERARTAAQDSAAIAYVGEPHPALTAVSAPILNEAGMLQISPAPIDPELLGGGPGADGVPREWQPTGTRTLGSLLVADSPPPPGYADADTLPAFRERFGRRAGPSALVGYEAVAVILDAIERAGDPLDRESVIDAYLATADRDSPLGHYSVDSAGVARFDR